MDYYKRALELNDETVKNRRYFHTNAETGLHMPMACAYVMDKLTKYGLTPSRCGEGVTATVGNGGKVLLLRADMDALPMPEESGLPFACPTGKEAHACGHDFHAAMLLTAAKMLKENEAELKGTVKFMFQPAEETFEGSKNMIEHGILENPKVDAALAYHVSPGQMPVGIYMYNSTGTMMYSVDGFHIEIKGKGSHGAYPQNSIDPINIAAHVYLALQSIIAREVDRDKPLIIAVQPTRGLDVGAIEYIHKQLVAQRDAGKAVLLVSLELDEVMSLSDRILVMYEGEIVGELDPKNTTQEELGLYMAGAKRDEVKA